MTFRKGHITPWDAADFGCCPPLNVKVSYLIRYRLTRGSRVYQIMESGYLRAVISRRRVSSGLMPVQRVRSWSNTETTLGQRHVFAVIIYPESYPTNRTNMRF